MIIENLLISIILFTVTTVKGLPSCTYGLKNNNNYIVKIIECDPAPSRPMRRPTRKPLVGIDNDN